MKRNKMQLTKLEHAWHDLMHANHYTRWVHAIMILVSVAVLLFVLKVRKAIGV